MSIRFEIQALSMILFHWKLNVHSVLLTLNSVTSIYHCDFVLNLLNIN